MASACAFSAVHALARVTRRAPRLASRAIRPSRFSSRASSRLSAAGTNLEIAFEKTKHNEELSCTRDTMVGGCSECTMPNENERAVVLADAALRNHSRLLQMEQGAKTKTKGESSKMSLRVLVVGAETGKLVSELLAKGATHVLVIDHSQKMLDRSSEAFDALGVAGNAIGARFLRADVSDVPAYQGPFDAIIFNDTLRQEFDPSDSLRRSVLLTRPGARVVVSEREGDDGGERDSVRLDLVSMTRDLPVQAIDDNPSAGKTMCAEADFDSGDSSQDDSSSFDSTCSSNVWTYEVPPLFSLANPVAMTAPVVAGFGRGSKLMGVPTANLAPELLTAELSKMRRGVYFGYARLPNDVKHRRWCKCVVNVGERPTFADGEGVTVEVHALRDFGRDFYGETAQVVVVGFLRPEMRFDGFQALVARIMADIGIAKNALDDTRCRERVDRGFGFNADE